MFLTHLLFQSIFIFRMLLMVFITVILLYFRRKMSAAVQRKLEFPVRKSTRLRSKDINSCEPDLKPDSPRKRTKNGIF